MQIIIEIEKKKKENIIDCFENEKYKHLWVHCENCDRLNYQKYFKLIMNICEQCGYHLKIKNLDRIDILIDTNTWYPICEHMDSLDPIEFDSKGKYTELNIELIELNKNIKSIELEYIKSDIKLEPIKSNIDTELNIELIELNKNIKSIELEYIKLKKLKKLKKIIEFNKKLIFYTELKSDIELKYILSDTELEFIKSDIELKYNKYNKELKYILSYLLYDTELEFNTELESIKSDTELEYIFSNSVLESIKCDNNTELENILSNIELESDILYNVELNIESNTKIDIESEYKFKYKKYKYIKSEYYMDRIELHKKNTGLQEAIQIGIGKLKGIFIAMGIMDFQFIGGSMGSAVGEKIALLIEYATEKNLPLIIVCASGGARMQEGIFGLTQMAKISSLLHNYYYKTKLLYISILTSPTTGGVTASFGMLGNIIITEPNASIAFAGKRVIEQTLHIEVPEGIQESEFLFEKGSFNLIIPRNLLKYTIIELFKFHHIINII
nr:acetyl-CoA carboxylase carboxyltransferase beta subunit [Thismia huangii]